MYTQFKISENYCHRAKPGSSVKDFLGQFKQTINFLLVNSHLTKKSMTESSHVYAVC